MKKETCFALKMFSCLLNRCESWSWSVNFVTSFQSVYIFILSVRFIYATSFRKYFKKENTQNLRMFFFAITVFDFKEIILYHEKINLAHPKRIFPAPSQIDRKIGRGNFWQFRKQRQTFYHWGSIGNCDISKKLSKITV